jgi:hypothetical protein
MAALSRLPDDNRTVENPGGGWIAAKMACFLRRQVWKSGFARSRNRAEASLNDLAGWDLYREFESTPHAQSGS